MYFRLLINVALLSCCLAQAALAVEPPADPVSSISRTISGCAFMVPLGLVGPIGPELTITWSGPCHDGVISGAGVLRAWIGDKDAFSFEGQARDGMLDGTVMFRKGGLVVTTTYHEALPGPRIVLSFPSGSDYEGEAVHGQPEGQGISVQRDGTRYDGSWHHSMRDGHGVSTWPSGAVYDGNWRDNQPFGRGAMAYADGDRYEGEFRGGKRNGHGVFTYSNGDRIEAEWKDNLPVTALTFTSPTGVRYAGSIGPDLRLAGQGTMILPNGATYDGEWRSGLPDGVGTMTRPDGVKFTGTWTHGCFSDGDARVAFRVPTSSCGKR